MPSFNGRTYTGVQGLNVKSQNGCIRFETPDVTPSAVSGERKLFVNSSNQLIYDDGSSQTALGGVGSVTVTWEAMYNADNTLVINGGAGFSIQGNVANSNVVLTLSNIAGGSGACLAFSNSGSGNDVTGTSSTWQVTAAGVATFAGISISGTSSALVSTGAAVWTLLDNSSTSLRIGASGATTMVTFDTTNGSEVVKFGNAIQVTDGIATLISTSNTVANLLVTNNTASTWGASAASAGVVVFRSTSLTTGTLLRLQLTEGTLNGGFYVECYDATAGGAVFTIGEDGAHVITGAGGSDMLTLSAGDAVLSDGSLTMTDADNAATLAITNDTATTASVFVFAGSGVFTGNTTSSFMTITPSGLTTGTAIYVPVAALTQGKALSIVGNALTSGILVNITSSATAITGAGRMLYVSHSGATGSSATLVEFASAANDETVICQVTASDALAAGKALVVSGVAVTTGTLLDVSNGDALTTGKLANFVGNSADTGTRSLVYIKQDHASASGATALEVVQDGALAAIKVTSAATSTNYFKIATMNGVTLWMGNGTTANGNLSGTAGDILFNGGSGKPEYCSVTGTTWVALV